MAPLNILAALAGPEAKRDSRYLVEDYATFPSHTQSKSQCPSSPADHQSLGHGRPTYPMSKYKSYEGTNFPRAAIASQGGQKADNQTSCRLFGLTQPQVRLPPAPSASKVTPHLRGLTKSSSPSPSASSIKSQPEIENVCPICDGSYTHHDPGLITPCCGLTVHELCNHYAVEESGECHGCHGKQGPNELPEPSSPSETHEYIYHFVTDLTNPSSKSEGDGLLDANRPESYSLSSSFVPSVPSIPSSLKSEEIHTSDTLDPHMTLGEYIESQSGLFSASTSLFSEPANSTTSWLSSVEDDSADAEPLDAVSEAWDDSKLPPTELAPIRSAGTEAAELLKGATDHLANLIRHFGRSVSEPFKDTLVEKIIASVDASTSMPLKSSPAPTRPVTPPLPVVELEAASRPTTSPQYRQELTRLLHLVASGQPGSSPSPPRKSRL